MSGLQASLAGIRVLDLSRNLPGPLATMFLADMGAQVIKVEDTRTGDPVRIMPPLVNGVSVFFNALNRSKRSLSLDLKNPLGKKIALDLAATCDVVVEGFRPGVLARLGLSFQELQAVRPDIILCSITGYGQSGPDRDTPGHDINYCARAGILGQTGTGAGEPALLGAQLADVAGGSWPALTAILAALFQRSQTGRGQWLDIAMADGVLSTGLLTSALQMAGMTPPGPGQGPLTGGMPCYGLYSCADGEYLSVGALEPHFFDDLCRAMDLEDLVGQGLSFGEPAQQVKDRLGAKFSEHDRDWWLTHLADSQTCVEAVLSTAEVMEHPQYAAREMFYELDTPAGAIKQLACPIVSSGQPSRAYPPPRLGQHNLEILNELGCTGQEVEEFIESGALGRTESH